MIHNIRIKQNMRRALSLVAAFVIALNIFAAALPLRTSAQKPLFQTGYTFDSANPLSDISGNYDLSDTSDVNIITGYSGYGNKSTLYLPRDMFYDNTELTMSFRIRLDDANSYLGTSILYVGAYGSGAYIDMSYSKYTNRISLSYFSGSRTCMVSASMPSDSGSNPWHLVTFSLGASGGNYYLNLYINGIPMSSSRCYEDLSGFTPTVAYFSDCSIDDVYVTNRCLDDNDVLLLTAYDMATFMRHIDSTWVADKPDIPGVIDPINPWPPIDPTVPGYYENPDRIVTPITDFSWSSHIFESSFDLTRDLNGSYGAKLSTLDVSSVNTENYKGTFGRGITRRWDSYPSYVLAFNEGLLYSANSFTVGAWVYWESESQVSEVMQSSIVVDEVTGEEATHYTYYNKQIPALKGTVVDEIYDLYGNKIDKASCFSYDEFGAVIDQTTVYAYDKNGRLLNLLDGTYFNATGRFYVSELNEVDIIYDATTMLPYTGTPVWTAIEKTSSSDITSKIFDFEGKGIVSFTPYAVDENGNTVAQLTYGADRNAPITVSLGKATNVKGKWVHYALSFDRAGVIRIYTNGKLTDSVSTKLKLSDLKLCNLYVISDLSESEHGRFLLDEVYMSAKVLSDSEIRKLRYYGAARYSTEALPDPDPESSSQTPADPNEGEEIDLRPDETDELEDAYIDTAVIDQYIGTSFDDSAFIGRDYNNAVSAVIRNASLKQGVKTYGLALNGINSYIRYPIGILDGAEALTVSIAYNWTGLSTSQRSQKLFDFSRKTQSVDAPTSYITLSMGDGMSGLELAISDGTNTTVLNSNINVTNKWVRATVIIANGKAMLYLDDTMVASTSTKVDVSVINPNYNYIGKSGVKGDPLFNGAVDEIYISSSAITEEKLASLVKDGIEPVTEKNEQKLEDDFEEDLWNNIITGVLVATGLLVLVIIIIIIVAIIKK